MTTAAPEQTCGGTLRDYGDQVRRLHALADRYDARGKVRRAQCIRRAVLQMQMGWLFIAAPSDDG